MKTIRLVLVACALAPFAFTGCASDEKQPAAPQAAAVASPKPAADALNRSLAGLSLRIRTVDAALGRVVGDSATDPEERLAALNKAVAGVGRDTAVFLGADLDADGADVVEGWRASAASITDPDLRKIATTNGDDAKARFDAVQSALRGADAAIAYHSALLKDLRSALGAHPNATQLVAARPASKRLTAAGEKVAGWLTYAAQAANKAGRAPVPVVVEPAPKAEPAEATPVVPAPAPAPTAVAPAPAPVVEPPVAAPEKAPEPVEARPPVEAPKPAEPVKSDAPAPAPQPDPVPEPKETN